MQYQRRQITGTQQDKPVGHRALLVVKGSAILFAVQFAVWFILAWNDNPLHVIVFMTWGQAVIVWFGVMVWVIRQLR